MRRVRELGCFLLAVALTGTVRPAQAQIAQLADDLVILSNRLRAKENTQIHQHLGPGPGSMESLFPIVPGAPRPVPGEPSSSMIPGQARITPPTTRLPAPTPLYGVMDVPATTDEGPPTGLTIDRAIDRLVEENYDLRTRFKELDKARADILSAGLRNNPFLFGNVGNVTYGNYSRSDPAARTMKSRLSSPGDVNRKRLSRIRVAQCARNVLEALYQDAVRLEIDNLYTAFLDVLAAREAVRSSRSA